MSHATLPPELWLAVFAYATTSPLTDALHTTAYKAFQAALLDAKDVQVLETRRALSLVCKCWRRLLYSCTDGDVTISSKGLAAMRGPSDTEEERSTYRRVRRVCLPYYPPTPYPTREPAATALRSLSDEVEILVRPSDLPLCGIAFDHLAPECPPLPALQRLDWWYVNDAARSGGFNSLYDVLHAAPRLRYLSLGGELGIDTMHRGALALAALETLHVRRTNALMVHQLARWRLPALRHVVVDGSGTPLDLTPLWAAHGARVRAVELGAHHGWLCGDALGDVLAACPDLEELAYSPALAPAPRKLPAPPHTGLKTLRWRMQGGTREALARVGDHVVRFVGPAFPALQRVVLYGDWTAVIEDEGWALLAQKLQGKVTFEK